MNHRIIQLLVLLLGSSLMALSGLSPPGDLRAQTDQTEEECFAATGFCISGRIAEYWRQNGGLPVFGLPITPQRPETIEGQTIEVQWFERNRLELHPDNEPPYDVLLGRLGNDVLAQQGREWWNFPTEEDHPGGGVCDALT
ncbi:MAG: hypothetical protein HC837_20835 [Chloroflexaceae bacterium]|nr:hypothetical protein [Chloroflexaceae bacterium]